MGVRARGWCKMLTCNGGTLPMLTEKVKKILAEINNIDKKRLRLRAQRERLQLKLNKLENEQGRTKNEQRV